MTIIKEIDIIDIRRTKLEINLVQDILRGLHPDIGKEKTLPTLLLYDEAGLKLFEKITYLDEYYVTNAEIEVLERHATDIANRIQPGTSIIDLGSGNLRKVKILLDALELAQKNVEFFALDLSEVELCRTLHEASASAFRHVKCHGLLGTFDDGLAWLDRAENKHMPKCIMYLGSSIGNLTRPAAADFVERFAQTMHAADFMLIGIDACQDPRRVYDAYNDREGVTHEFLLNGLKHANKLLGKPAFDISKWKIVGRYNEAEDRHEAFCVPLEDVEIEGVQIHKGEMVCIEQSYKYSAKQTEELWKNAGVVQVAAFENSKHDYQIHMCALPAVAFPLNASEYAPAPVPSLVEFENLWKCWDSVSRGMIPQTELLSKPIKLRNACIFYLGHIPTFLDIHLNRAGAGEPTEPKQYQLLFERGIDPDVDNPEHCHWHSEIPDEWPPVEDILDYQDRVRNRVRALWRENVPETDAKVGRALWIGFEHEVMHIETLLYMLLQSNKMLEPPGTKRPDFAAMAKEARSKAVPNEWISIPASKVRIGVDDPDRFVKGKYFGWDNEGPARIKYVPEFMAKARPITNGEYAAFLLATRSTAIPASWTGLPFSTNGVAVNDGSDIDEFMQNKYVKTVFGPVPLSNARDWPAIASYDELAGCAKYMNGRIPTFEELRSIYSFVDAKTRTEKAERVLGKSIPAVNAHLSNDGVEETPPLNVLFADLDSDAHNVGFRTWHPTPVSAHGGTLCGQGETGGAWEWTSTTLEAWPRFEPMDVYPGYTADFFDTKHNIVCGGSWATHPRVAGRRSFVNWYQRNYAYAWTTARLVKDVNDEL